MVDIDSELQIIVAFSVIPPVGPGLNDFIRLAKVWIQKYDITGSKTPAPAI